MKKQNHIYIAAAMALITFGSCKKDFLTQSPEASVTGQNFYQSEGQIKDAVNGAYNSLQIMGSNSIFANAPLAGGYWQFGELRSDNTTFQYNPNGRGDEQVWFIDKFIISSTYEPIKNYWQQNYKAIYRDNDVLEHIDGVPMDIAKKNQYTGEAKFLRAFNYFNLVRQFGGVPLRIKATASPEEAKSGGRATEEAVYTQIIADLKDAAEKLPVKYTGIDIGRATQGAARTLLAKVYMTQKKFSDALTELRKVETLGYSLQSNYANIYSPANKNNSESLFEIQYFGGRTDMSSYFMYEFAPIDSRNLVISDPALANNDGGVGMNIPTPDLLAAYDAGDLRKDASIGMLTYQFFGTTVTVPYCKKYNWGIVTSRHTDVNFPVMRYADVLLMIAECLNETANSGEALTYLNMVHAHPRTGLSAINISGQAQIRDLIMKERQVELAFENHRWYDLVRTGKAVEVMTAHGARQKAQRPTTEVEPSAYQITPQKLLLPIPQLEITLDNLQQNPGY